MCTPHRYWFSLLDMCLWIHEQHRLTYNLISHLTIAESGTLPDCILVYTTEQIYDISSYMTTLEMSYNYPYYQVFPNKIALLKQWREKYMTIYMYTIIQTNDAIGREAARKDKTERQKQYEQRVYKQDEYINYYQSLTGSSNYSSFV